MKTDLEKRLTQLSIYITQIEQREVQNRNNQLNKMQQVMEKIYPMRSEGVG